MAQLYLRYTRLGVHDQDQYQDQYQYQDQDQDLDKNHQQREEDMYLLAFEECTHISHTVLT